MNITPQFSERLQGPGTNPGTMFLCCFACFDQRASLTGKLKEAEHLLHDCLRGTKNTADGQTHGRSSSLTCLPLEQC